MDNSKVILIVCVILLVSAGAIFLVPVPYSAIEVYTVQEPYTTTETYTEIESYMGIEYYQDQEPITVEECRIDISLNPEEYLWRGVDALLTGDTNKLLETCENVIQYRTVQKARDVIKQRPVQKEREVIKYRDVKKERTVVNKATLFMIWTGQVDYYYEI